MAKTMLRLTGIQNINQNVTCRYTIKTTVKIMSG